MNTDASPVAYGLIADCLRSKTLVPFLGAAASRVGADEKYALPDGARLAQLLAAKAHYPGSHDDALTKVTQYIEEIAGDRDMLLNYVNDTFNTQVQRGYRSSTTAFIAEISRQHVPDLIATTNYDITVEMTLEELGIPYLAISHIFGNSKYFGRLLCYENLSADANVVTVTQMNEMLLALEEKKEQRVIIYKMHGSSRPADTLQKIDSVILTENDYVRFLAQDTYRHIPMRVQRKLAEARLLYLGYSLQDWNFRVLLKKIRDMQNASSKKTEKRTIERRHWACVLDPDPVEKQFWAERGVTLYSIDLGKFLLRLCAELGRGNKA
jgi:hypothetical protein